MFVMANASAASTVGDDDNDDDDDAAAADADIDGADARCAGDAANTDGEAG